MSEFAVKVNHGRKQVYEKITIDIENETETFHLEEDDTGKIHDVLFDFKRVSRVTPKDLEWQRHPLSFFFFQLIHSPISLISFFLLSS